MYIEKLSLKTLTLSILLMLGLASVAVTLLSSSRYQAVAVAAQTSTLSQMIEVAYESTLAKLRQRALGVAEQIRNHPELYAAWQRAHASPGENAQLEAQLQQQLQAQLRSEQRIGLLGLQAYDSELRPLAGNPNEGPALPASLRRQLLTANQTDTDLLWSDASKAYYSVFVPIGTQPSLGYLELVLDPVVSLRAMQTTLPLPFRIHSPAGLTLYQSDSWHSPTAADVVVQYTVYDDAQGSVLLGLEVLENLAGLQRDITQVRSTTLFVNLLLSAAVLIVAIVLFSRFLFRPVAQLMRDMQRAAEGELDVTVNIRALKDLNVLATAFNRMTEQVRNLVERERQHAEDITGKVELIQGVVENAAQGDLTSQLMIYRDNDVISELAVGIQGMLDSLNGLVARIQQSGIQVTSSATEIAATAKQQEATVTEQAATTNEIRATVTQISATSKELVNTMHEVTDVAFKTAENANQGRSSLTRMEDTMRNMLTATSTISAKLAVLSEKAGNINTVVTTITKVSDQTNLLSLNAAIEAEKAGEYGVGFAVVATEIRRLADQTAVATWDIEQMVKEMQSAVSAGVMGMEKFSVEVRQGVDDVRRVGAQLTHIIEQVENLIPHFEEVHEGMQSQAKGAAQITEAMIQLADSSQQTAESLRQSNTAIGQLNEAARRLQEGVSHFKVNG